MAKLKANTRVRKENFRRQYDFFQAYSQFFSCPQQLPASATPWLAFPVLIKDDAPFSRTQFQIYLEQRNIQTRVVFTGNILRQPMCKGITKKEIDSGYANADNVMKNGILLPLHHAMTDGMFDRLHSTIEEFLHEFILL